MLTDPSCGRLVLAEHDRQADEVPWWVKSERQLDAIETLRKEASGQSLGAILRTSNR
jgi:hypothetical protein